MGTREPSFNYFNYYTEIEEHFILRRGKHILLSPLDWTLIETWQAMGIPLHVALRGIDRALAAFREKQSRQRLVNSLFYCNQAVIEEYEQHLISQEGSRPDEGETNGKTEPEPASPDLTRFLECRLNELRRLAADHPGTPAGEDGERLAVRLAGIIEEVRRTGRPDPARVDADLRAIDETLAPSLAGTLPPEERQTLLNQCRQELRHHRASLPPNMYQRILDSLVRRRIRERFGVSDLSLLESR
jgi:hypothetical protein